MKALHQYYQCSCVPFSSFWWVSQKAGLGCEKGAPQVVRRLRHCTSPGMIVNGGLLHHSAWHTLQFSC